MVTSRWPRYTPFMRSAIVDLALLVTATLLLFFVVDTNDSLRFVLPTYGLLKNNLVIVVGAIAILVAVRVVTREPRVRSR